MHVFFISSGDLLVIFSFQVSFSALTMKDKTLDIGHCCARHLAIHLYHPTLVIFKLDGTAVGYSRSTKVTRGVGIATQCCALQSSLFRMVFFRRSWYCTESCYQFHSLSMIKFQAMVLDDVLYDVYAWYSYPRSPYEFIRTPGSDSPGGLPGGYP